LLEFAELGVGIPLGRQHGSDVVLPEHFRDRSGHVGPGIHDLGGAGLPGGNDARPELHPAVRQGRSVLDDEHRLPSHELRVVQLHNAVSPQDRRPWVQLRRRSFDLGDAIGVRGPDLVDQDDVCHP
jgi:hypothetical protein